MLNYYNGPQELTPTLHSFLFSFHILPFASMSTYQRMRSENESMQKRIKEIAEQLRQSPTAHTYMDYFKSDDPEDKKKIAEFDRLRQSLHQLPDFYYEKFSLQEARNYVVPTDENTFFESRRVHDAAVNSLFKYQ